MDYSKWKSIYKKIITDLIIKEIDDYKSAGILEDLLNNCKTSNKSYLKKLLENQKITIFGAGPSLEDSINIYDYRDNTLVAADGATSALLKNNIVPDIIVTDLDGYVPDQIKSNQIKGIVIIHAHGNNIEKINKYVRKFEGNIIGTTQIDPSSFKNLYNFGGFTDGDRAVFLADHFKAKTITLVGFDFNGEIGKYSFPEKKDIALKFKKLKWCKKLIEYLQESNKNIKYF